jgi:hypothetical protein
MRNCMILRAPVRRRRRADDVPRGDGKVLESSIGFRYGQQCSSSAPLSQTYGFFTRGSVIGGESISLRASSVINMLACGMTTRSRHSTLPTVRAAGIA